MTIQSKYRLWINFWPVYQPIDNVWLGNSVLVIFSACVWWPQNGNFCNKIHNFEFRTSNHYKIQSNLHQPLYRCRKICNRKNTFLKMHVYDTCNQNYLLLTLFRPQIHQRMITFVDGMRARSRKMYVRKSFSKALMANCSLVQLKSIVPILIADFHCKLSTAINQQIWNIWFHFIHHQLRHELRWTACGLDLFWFFKNPNSHYYVQSPRRVYEAKGPLQCEFSPQASFVEMYNKMFLKRCSFCH